MANYDVSIKLAVAGAKQLDKVNKRTEQLAKNIDFINNKAQKGTAGTPLVRNFKNLSNAVTDARDALDKAAIGTKEFNQAVKNVVKVEDKFNRQQKIKERALKVEKLSIKEGITLKEAKIRIIQEEIKLENKLANAKAKAEQKEKVRRRNRIISGVGVGGGFPLLFGAGPISAVAGGLGGGIGEALSPGGGFAGSIAATAIVGQVQAFVDSSSKLGQAMSSLTPDTNALAQAMGIVGTQEEKRIQAIEKLSGKQAAFNAAMDKMRETIGDEATDRLKAFGETSRLIGNEFAIAMTKMQAFGVRFINLFDKIFGLSASAEKSQRDRAIKNSTNSEILRIQSEIEEVRKGRMRGSRRDKRLKVLRDELKVLGDQEVKTNKIAAKNETDRVTLEASLRATTDKTKFLQDTLQFGEQEAEIRQRILQFERAESVVLDANGKQRIRNAMDLERSLQRQVELTKAIGASFRDSFRDAITGATSFNQAMVNVLNTIRDRLIGMYLDQMFAQATTGGGGGFLGNLFGGLLGGIFGGGGGGGAFGGAPLGPLGNPLSQHTTKYVPGMQRANGGPVRGGSSYLVGERGPEMFSPGVSGTITPNHALGGSTTVVVNVDASGSSVQGNEAQGKVLGQVLATAIQSELVKQKRPGGLLS